MSGKSYTMKEMKAIVEYLTEHRAYGDIKGRKMWMNLASSKVTNRTWQSLKETFLKRILPDIHNPYYKLSLTQISSFQQGHDIEVRINNKLEIRSTSQNSDTDGDIEKDTEKPGTSNGKNETKTAGEDPKLSNLRASTETVVLENCYENAEEIRKDLQSPVDEVEGTNKMQPNKSMRELITYSEPITPMIQSVIDDFRTDDEESEPQMQIVESEKTSDKNDESCTIEISDSEGNDIQEATNQILAKNSDPDHAQSHNENKQAKDSLDTKESEVVIEKSSALMSELNDTNIEKDSSEVKISDRDNLKSLSEVTQNNSVNIADTLLPGNQEAFDEKLKKKPDKHNLSLNKKENLQNGRKRASSQDSEQKSLNRKLSKMKSISDTEKSNSTKGFVFNKSEFSTLKQAPPKDTNVNSSNMNGEKCENTPTPKEQAVDHLQNNITKNTAEIENPCLKNVSLYDEQFSTEKYTDSDTVMENDNNKKGRRTQMRDNKVENLEDENNTVVDEKNKSEDKNKQSDRMGKKMSDKNKKIDHTKKVNDDNVNVNAKNEMSIDKNDEAGEKNGQGDAKAKSTACQTNQDHISNKAISRSESGSSSEYGNDPVILGKKKHIKQQKRERALDHMFGFASGGKRPVRGAGYRKRTTSQSHTFNYGNMSTASSEWTSDTGSEIVVPQRHCAIKRRPRKYLKPRSERILSLEEEGGLFVMYGRKIYPIVQKGKLVKNYVTYTQEDDAEESFWKMKYVEEKKKTDELTKMLNDAKVDEPSTKQGESSSKQGESSSKQGESSLVSPKLPTTTPSRKSSAHSRQEDTHKQVETKTDPVTIPAVRVPAENPNPDQRKTVKIKFIKKNQEVELEGHWSQLNPVLDHVAQLFQKEPETLTISSSSSKKAESPAGEPLVESGKSTPTDEVVQKVNQREIKIAEEIERYYKQENLDQESPAVVEINVTKRKCRPIKSPDLSSTIAKKAKLDVEAETHKTAEKAEQSSAAEDITTRTRRTRVPKKFFETNQRSNSEVNQTNIRTRRSTSRISQDKTADTKQSNPKEEEDVRYKFPHQPTRKSNANKSQSTVAKNTPRRKSKSATNLVSSPGNIPHTLETTQEYPDSDFCVSTICINGGRKTCLSFSTNTKRHYTTHLQQRTNSNITDDITSESSNSFQNARIESMTFQNSTITSEIYKSESYRLLMNNDPSHTRNTTKLRSIEETSLASKDFDENKEAIAASDNIDLENKENMVELTQVNTDNENSSNVSLPTSPVLSIVENISISKTLLSSMDLDDYPIDDKVEHIDSTDQIMLNGLMTPDVDVTMPLMEQECGIEKSSHDGKAYHYNLSVSKTVPAVSESLLNKINTVNIGDPSLSESLNVKLKDLLLESTKKRFKNKGTVKNKTKDVEVKDKPEPKKDNSKKRSSTPRKRIRKPTLPDTEPRLVEEHIESCRHGRQSCPPVILISDQDTNALITPTETAQFITTRKRKKKDIIKVKILKPKAKTQDNSLKQSDTVNFTDSDMDDTESDIKLHGLNDSVDLIHNHSDTCLNAHECMGDSVKIIDNSASSIISLDSTSAHSDIVVRHSTVGNLTQELFSSDAQDGSNIIKEFDFAEPRQVNSASTVYHTPLGTQSSPTSIITDDLSNEVPEEPVQNKRWYLFSEDESSNTNCFNKNSKAFGCGANLEQIFPVACAIPDLSTITEISRENGDSKKFCDDTNTTDRLNSPSIFI